MLKKSICFWLFFLFFASYPIFAEEDNNCKLPYRPNDLFTVIFNYSEGMTYISSTEKTRSNIFAQELSKTFRESFWISEGCLEVTLQDIEKAKTARKDKLALNVVNSPKSIVSN